jgi:hypothetical protein
MFIEGNARSNFNKNALDHSNVPIELIDIARWWTEFTPVNPKTGEVYNLYDERPETMVIPTTPDAEAIINRLGLQADNNYRNTNDGIEQTAWTRARENAIKLAMIYACSTSYEQPVIDADAASWATEFVYWIQNKMVDMIRKHVADQPFTKQCLRAKDIIRKHGGMIPRAELSKTMRIRPRELDEVIQSLLTEESIELIIETSNTKPRTLYKLVIPDTP